MKDKRWDKIITERPRSGGTRQDSTQKVRARDHSLMALEKFENLAKQERLNPGGPMNYFDLHSKRFSDLITPLKAWLDKQVGRPWDKVKSDIHNMVNTKKVTGRHVMDHVNQWVKENVEIDGKNVVLEDLALGRNRLGDAVHRKNILRHGYRTPVERRETAAPQARNCFDKT